MLLVTEKCIDCEEAITSSKGPAFDIHTVIDFTNLTSLTLTQVFATKTDGTTYIVNYLIA